MAEGTADCGYSPRVRMAARMAAGACALIAGVVLIGWAAGLPVLTTFGRDWTPMVASTALCVLAAATATLVIVRKERVPAAPQLGACGLVCAVIGIVTLADFVSVWTRGVPLYPPSPAWRMAPTTAVIVATIGAVLILWGTGRGGRARELLVGFALVLSAHTLLAFLLGATPKSDLLGRVNMSPITGLALVTLALTLLLLIPGGRIAGIVNGAATGSRAARPLLLLLVLVPVILGWVLLRGEQAGFITLEYAVSLMVLGTAMVSTAAIVSFAERVNGYERAQRRDMESRLFLSNVSDTLGRSVDLEPTLASIARLCVPALADWCVIALCRPDGSLHNVAVMHADPERVQWAHEYQRRFPPAPDAPTGAAAVARTGEMEFHREIPDSLLDAATRDPEQRRIIRALGMRSAMSLPLISSGRTFGVLTLVTAESGRLFDDEDVRIARQVADRCAVAIERARLFDDLGDELARRREAEAELQALTAELEQRVARRTAELAVANRELESFAYSVSHDLRTPLRGLDGFSQALLEDYGERLDDTAKDYLTRIRRGSQRMGDLIDSMLELSRVSRGELQRQPVDFSAMATDLLDSLREASPDRQVRLHVQPNLTATGDPRLLRALLQNLLGNAWKFSARRPDASIEFRMEEGNGRPGPVFVVRDNGAGFDMTYASRLFGAFQRLHSTKEFEGTGVGLATAQRIVHRHAGEIWARSAPGEGAAFYFTLGSTGQT